MGDGRDGAPDGVITPMPGLLCDWCGAALPPPTRKTKNARRFCKPGHRAAWHKARRIERIEAARASINTALDELKGLK